MENSNEFKAIKKYLEYLSNNMELGTVWTEGHWKEANEILLCAKVLTKEDSWKDIHERMFTKEVPISSTNKKLHVVRGLSCPKKQYDTAVAKFIKEYDKN